MPAELGDLDSNGLNIQTVKAVFDEIEFACVVALIAVEGIFNSACIAIAVTILATLISIPLAVLSVRYDFRGKGLLSGLLLVPLILPPFVGAIDI